MLDPADIILLKLPPSCKGAKNVVRLNRGIYGLRQSALMWYNNLKDSLKEFSFKPIKADPCVFTHPVTKEIIVVYVDNLILVTKNRKLMEILKEKLLKRYKARDLSLISYYLGIRVVWNRSERSIKLSIEAYVERLVTKYYLNDAPISLTPLPTSVLKLERRNPTNKADLGTVKQYQLLVAKLLYPTSIIQPNLAWHVNFMARFATNLTEEQLSMLKHMLRYYKGTANLGLKYRGNRKDANINNPDHTLGLTAYSDSAHRDNTERKSTASYVIFIASGVVLFKSY
jgi:hypothetical protein